MLQIQIQSTCRAPRERYFAKCECRGKRETKQKLQNILSKRKTSKCLRLTLTLKFSLQERSKMYTSHTHTQTHRVRYRICIFVSCTMLRSFFHSFIAFYSLYAFSHTHFAQSKSLRFGCHPQLAIVAIV